MIQSKQDMKYYIESDLRSLQCYPITLKMRMEGVFHPTIMYNLPIWKSDIHLRV